MLANINYLKPYVKENNNVPSKKQCSEVCNCAAGRNQRARGSRIREAE